MPPALLRELQRYKDTTRYAALDAEVLSTTIDANLDWAFVENCFHRSKYWKGAGPLGPPFYDPLDKAINNRASLLSSFLCEAKTDFSSVYALSFKIQMLPLDKA